MALQRRENTGILELKSTELGACHVCVEAKLIYSLPYLFAAVLLDRDIDLTSLTSGTYKCGLWI